jgi:hypothetical protein
MPTVRASPDPTLVWHGYQRDGKYEFRGEENLSACGYIVNSEHNDS